MEIPHFLSEGMIFDKPINCLVDCLVVKGGIIDLACNCYGSRNIIHPREGLKLHKITAVLLFYFTLLFLPFLFQFSPLEIRFHLTIHLWPIGGGLYMTTRWSGWVAGMG